MVNNVFFSAVTEATLSRHQLLAWVNESLQACLQKIEDMSTGSAYCGLTDLLFPGSVQLKKVKWNSKNEVDWINNWRILQGAWKDLGVDKPIPVERLLKAKFQENFEFLQWFKKFFDANYEEHDYDSLAARNYEEFPAALPGGNKAAPRVPPARSAPKTTAPSTRRSIPASTTATKSAPAAQKAPTSSNGTADYLASIEEKHKKELEQLMQDNALLSENIAAIEKERDFYFNKLRAVEVLCTEAGEEAQINTQLITKILYEAEEDEAADDSNVEGGNSTHIVTQEEAGEKNGQAIKELKLDEALTQKIDNVGGLDDSETF